QRDHAAARRLSMRIHAVETNSDQMNRSEAQRRYQNIITYQVRPMLGDRGKSEEDRVMLMKRVCSEANLIRADSGAAAGAGARAEIGARLPQLLKPTMGTGDELRGWITRVFRSFGAAYEAPDMEI